MQETKPVIKPDYYDEFFCIADKCTFSCCNDWTITVDDATCERWKSIPVPKTMPDEGCKNLTGYTRTEDDTSVINMRDDGHCPFLNEKGLCHLVLAYGEECLAETCHMFPRECHEYDDHIEYNLLPACETALELLWKKNRFVVDIPGAIDTSGIIGTREEIRKLAEDESKSVEEILKEGFVLAMKSAGHDCTESADYAPFTVTRERFTENNELLLDVVSSYREQGIYMEDIEPVAQRAEYYEELLERVSSAPSRNDAFGKSPEMTVLKKKLENFRTYYETLQPGLRVLLQEEIYATLAMPDGDADMLLMKLEWLALEFAVLRHWYFLVYDVENVMSYKKQVHLTSVLLRIMGFCDADIEEYLCECFESPIWEQDYINLLL